MNAYVSSATISPYDAEPAHRVKMQKASEYCTASLPDGLPSVFSHFSFEVLSQHSIDQISPTAGELWSLLAVRTAASDRANAMQHSVLKGFLVTNSDMASEAFLDDLAESECKLAAFASQALRSPELVNSDGTVRRGRGRVLLPGTMGAKYVCAAIVAEIRAALQQTGHSVLSKRDSYRAAQELWASFIPPKNWGDPSNGWKRYFDAA